MIEFNFDKEPTGTTYKDIKKELISLFEPFQHIQSSRTKYINRLYFTPEFILMINKTLKCEMKCNCHPIKNNDYKVKLEGIILSKKHRDDWMDAIERIFDQNYLIKVLKKSII